MKKSFLAILLMAGLSFSFSTPERNPDVVASPTEKTFNSYGTVTLDGCTGTGNNVVYEFSVSHVSGPQIKKFNLIVNGQDTGTTVGAGGTFYVSLQGATSASFALTYPTAQYPVIYAAGVTSDFVCP